MPADIQLEKISNEDPESYNARYNSKIVAYLRLRWGYFGIYWYGQQIYYARVGGECVNSFPDKRSRNHYLDEAKDAIRNKCVWKGN